MGNYGCNFWRYNLRSVDLDTLEYGPHSMVSAHESWCDTLTGISTRCNCIASEYIDQIESLEEKLNLAVEALEDMYFYSSCSACDNNWDTKDKALAKIKGEK